MKSEGKIIEVGLNQTLDFNTDTKTTAWHLAETPFFGIRNTDFVLGVIGTLADQSQNTESSVTKHS